MAAAFPKGCCLSPDLKGDIQPVGKRVGESDHVTVWKGKLILMSLPPEVQWGVWTVYPRLTVCVKWHQQNLNYTVFFSAVVFCQHSVVSLVSHWSLRWLHFIHLEVLQEMLQPLLFVVITCKAMRASVVAGFPRVAVVAFVVVGFILSLASSDTFLKTLSIKVTIYIYIYI